MKKKILIVALVSLLVATCLLPCAAFASEAVNSSIFKYDLSAYDDLLFEESQSLGKKDIVVYDKNLDDSTINVELYKEWKDIRLEYLINVPKTPFAELQSAKLSLPVVYYISNNERVYLNVDVEDFMSLFNFSTFGVLHSTLKSIDYRGEDSDGTLVFRAVYYKTYYLVAKNSDGAFKNHYIDCNMSLEELTSEFLKSELLPAGIYEVFKNRLENEFKKYLDGRKIESLYGYWSYVLIPTGNVFNEFFHDTSSETFVSSNLYTYEFFVEYKTFENYMNLHLDYGYVPWGFSFILKVWGDLFFGKNFGSLNAYLSYVDGGESTVLISRNGSSNLDNDLSAGLNGTVDYLESVDWGKTGGWILAVLLAVVTIIVVTKLPKKRKR